MSAFGKVLLGAAGLVVWRIWDRGRRKAPAAFAEGQGGPDNATQIRDAGPEAMRDQDDRPWTEIEEDSDESFPASDPPGNY